MSKQCRNCEGSGWIKPEEAPCHVVCFFCNGTGLIKPDHIVDDPVDALRSCLNFDAGNAEKIAKQLLTIGFIITRAAAPMTDAELEREAEELAQERLKIVGQPDIVFSTPCLITVDDAIALAKKYRGV